MGLAALLGTEDNLEVVGEARNGEEAVSEALRLRPDLVLMDIIMPKQDGAVATRKIIEAKQGTKVLILTTYGSADGIAQALAAGASGAIMKSCDNGELLAAIRQVTSGATVISRDIRELLGDFEPIPCLTPRQLEVLSAMARGLTNAEIATALGIRKDGVNEHVIAILAKLGAANRTEAVAIAMRRHIL